MEVWATKPDCPGTSPPAGKLKYDFCAGEAFGIFKLKQDEIHATSPDGAENGITV